MPLIQFKTNINCNNCIAKVTPAIEQNLNIKFWEVDIEDSNKVLTVETEGSAEDVAETIAKAGYSAEEIG